MDEYEVKVMAWLYKEFRDTLMSFPSSIGDLIRDTPKWFEEEDNAEVSGVYQMMNIADRSAAKILKKK